MGLKLAWEQLMQSTSGNHLVSSPDLMQFWQDLQDELISRQQFNICMLSKQLQSVMLKAVNSFVAMVGMLMQGQSLLTMTTHHSVPNYSFLCPCQVHAEWHHMQGLLGRWHHVQAHNIDATVEFGGTVGCSGSCKLWPVSNSSTIFPCCMAFIVYT